MAGPLQRALTEARVQQLFSTDLAPADMLHAAVVVPAGGGQSLLGAAPCITARPGVLELLASLPEEALQRLEEQQVQGQLDQPRWFRNAITPLLRGIQQAAAQKALRETITARMEELVASDGVPGVADVGTEAQLRLKPLERWSENAKITINMLEHADEPSKMNAAAQKCWPHAPVEARTSWVPIAQQLRSTKAEIIYEHGGRWNVAAAKEYYAVLNAVEAVMNRRLEWAGIPLV